MLCPGKTRRVLVDVVESFGVNRILTAKRRPVGLFAKLVGLNTLRLI